MRIFLLLLITTSLFSCKKKVEDIKEDLVIKAMTDGKWKVSNFTVNGSSVSADFTNYRFKYYSDKTVDAINNTVTEKTGTWDGDAATMTTSASFTGAVYPLSLINGNWHIERNSWTFVEATQVSGSDTKFMRLDKE